MMSIRQFQQHVTDWALGCFGATIVGDRRERSFRFIEEAIELVQSSGLTKEEVHQMVDHVFSRPVGKLDQEVGGVQVTLGVFCTSHQIDLEDASRVELNRIWEKMEQIRGKQLEKPLRGKSATQVIMDEVINHESS